MRPSSLAGALFWGAVLRGYANGFRINHTRRFASGNGASSHQSARSSAAKSSAFVHPTRPSFSKRLSEDGSVMADARQRGWEPLIKPVVAIAGDHIALGETDIAVNGRTVPGSARMALSAGEIPNGTYDLLWVPTPMEEGEAIDELFVHILQERTALLRSLHYGELPFSAAV